MSAKYIPQDVYRAAVATVNEWHEGSPPTTADLIDVIARAIMTDRASRPSAIVEEPKAGSYVQPIFTDEQSEQSIDRQVVELDSLETDWDGYGADPLNSEILRLTAAIVKAGGTNTVVSLVPGSNGSVQAEWHLRGDVDVEYCVGPQGDHSLHVNLSTSPQPHTGRAGVTDEMVGLALEAWHADKHRTYASTPKSGMRAALNAALTVEPVAGEVTVKPLEWFDGSVETSIGRYDLYQDEYGWYVKFEGEALPGKRLKDKPAAADAAQADYTARIRSAIAP